MLKDEDILEWTAFVKGVAPLGKPLPSDYVAPPLYIVQPRTQLDLHGLTVHEAYRSTMDFVDGASGKYIMIITGLSGQIKKEFRHWFTNHKTVSRIEEMNGGGAYKIYFKKRLTKKS